MTSFASNLQFVSLVVHEVKIHDVVHDAGPRQPRNDIDVYLSPLFEHLTKLWDEGVLVFDGFQNETHY